MSIKTHYIFGLSIICPPGDFKVSLHTVSYHIRSKARIPFGPLSKDFPMVPKLDRLILEPFEMNHYPIKIPSSIFRI